MKHNFFYLFCLLLLTIACSGCKKFLDVRSGTTVVNPTTINDFEEILNSDSLAICNFFLADLASDDVRMTDNWLSQDTASYLSRTYLWAQNIWNPGSQDIMYNSTYTRILQMNIVLNGIDEVDASSQQKNVLRAQAQINRAWYYLQLVNIYGTDYQPATAATALAVPLILVPDASQLPERATVKQVYDQVLLDLNTAVASADLPGMGQTIVHPGKAAGYALIAKVYLYMGDYTKALLAADSALSIKNTLKDYNTGFINPGSLIDLSQNPETLLGRICIDYDFRGKYFNSVNIGRTLRALLDSNDTRLLGNFNTDSIFNSSGSFFNQQIFNYSVTVPDVLLIKAECLARKGAGGAAIDLVNQLRQNRLINFSPLPGTADALSTVLEERRRELFYHGGSRLFDLKRLNREGLFTQTLERVSDDRATVLATLSPNSLRYVIPFSPVIIANNPKILQNPR